LREFLEPNGNFKAGWEAKFGGDAELAKKYSSLESLVKGHMNMQTMLGKKGVPLPDANSTDEQWGEFFGKLGRPEKPDGYGLKKPEDMPAELWDDKRMGAFADVAHKAGLTSKQVGALLSWESSFVKAAVAEQKAKSAAASQTAEQALRQEWGVLYDKKLDGALRMAEALDPALVKDPMLANHPAFIRALAKMAGMVSETPMLGARDTNGAGNQSAKQRLDSIMSNPDDAYWRKDNPGHEARVDEVLMLRSQLRN